MYPSYGHYSSLQAEIMDYNEYCVAERVRYGSRVIMPLYANPATGAYGHMMMSPEEVNAVLSGPRVPSIKTANMDPTAASTPPPTQ